jgi:hypothetical protein
MPNCWSCKRPSEPPKLPRSDLGLRRSSGRIELVAEGTLADAEQLGGAGSVSTGGFQRTLNGSPLDLLQVEGKRLLSRGTGGRGRSGGLNLSRTVHRLVGGEDTTTR